MAVSPGKYFQPINTCSWHSPTLHVSRAQSAPGCGDSVGSWLYAVSWSLGLWTNLLPPSKQTLHRQRHFSSVQSTRHIQAQLEIKYKSPSQPLNSKQCKRTLSKIPLGNRLFCFVLLMFILTSVSMCCLAP